MTHAALTLNERLATPAELATFRTAGLRPAPTRQLASAPLAAIPAALPTWLVWPILTMAATTIGLVVIR
jgi:hypothetical protein